MPKGIYIRTKPIWNKGLKLGPNPQHSKRMKSIKWSSEIVEKRRLASIGKKRSIEARMNISNGRKGMKLTEEHKRNIGRSRPKKLNMPIESTKSKSEKMKKWWENRKVGVDKICKYCEKSFYVSKSLFDRRVYCSKKCHSSSLLGKKQDSNQIAKRAEKLKIPCSDEKKEKISKSLKNHLVTVETRNKISKAQIIDGRSYIRPGKKLYGDDWNSIRLSIYKRDNYACQECGIKMNEYGKALDIHHKIPFLVSFDNSPQNLITLCRKCHMKAEQPLKRTYKLNINETREKIKQRLSITNFKI